LGTPQTPAEGWLPSALPLLMITLHADLISLGDYRVSDFICNL